MSLSLSNPISLVWAMFLHMFLYFVNSFSHLYVSILLHFLLQHAMAWQVQRWASGNGCSRWNVNTGGVAWLTVSHPHSAAFARLHQTTFEYFWEDLHSVTFHLKTRQRVRMWMFEKKHNHLRGCIINRVSSPLCCLCWYPSYYIWILLRRSTISHIWKQRKKWRWKHDQRCLVIICCPCWS